MHPLVLLLSVVTIFASAQSVNTRLGARAAGMGQAGFGITDESPLFQNVGALGFVEHPSAFFSYELVPGLAGGNRTAAALAFPSPIAVFSAGAFRFGDDLYSEQLLTAGLGNRLGTTALGLKANLLQYRADGFGTRTAFTVDVGGLTQLTPEWTVGAGIFNITQATIAEDEPLPVIFVAAVSWQPPDGPLLTVETEKRLHAPLLLRGGMEVNIRKKVFARTGFSLQPLTLTAGIGARSYRTRLDFSTTYHPVLGFIYQASGIYRLDKRSSP